MIKPIRSFAFWLWLGFSIIFLGIFLPLFSIFSKDKEKLFASAIAFFSKILLLISWVPIEVQGKEQLREIDSTKPLLIAANHASFLDFFVLQAKLPLSCRYVVWRVGFLMPVIRTIYKKAGYIGIQKKKQNILSPYLIYKTLKSGKKLVVFSQPTMGNEASFEFKEEVAKLSSALQVPILPVAIKNCSQVFPMGKFLLGSGRIKIKIGQPAIFSSLPELQKSVLELYSQL